MVDAPYITEWPNKLAKLKDVVRASRQNLKYQRDARRALIKQYVGKYFSSKGSLDKVPRNMIDMAVSVWLGHLAARSPQVLVTTRFKQLQTVADELVHVINPLIEHEMKLGQTLTSGVREALFAPFGIVKVGLCRYKQADIDGYLHDYGQPFADVVDLDDFVVDLTVKRWDQIAYIGDRYSLPFEEVKYGGFFQNTEDLSPDMCYPEQDDQGLPKAKDLARDVTDTTDEWEDHIDVQDLWLPKYNLMITVPFNGDWSKPLKQIEWDGPEMGPYHRLSFVRVPGQDILGNSPLNLIRDLHEFANTIYLKIIRRAEESKHVVGFTGNDEEFARRVRDASDLQFIRMDNAQGVKEMMIGSPDQALFGLVQESEAEFKALAGNLDLIGGLQPASDTASQDKLLSANANKRMGAMQDQVMEWTKGIVQSIAFYVWEDPIREFPVTVEVPGTDARVTYGWGPEHREGDFVQYNFDIVPYSMMQRTPAEKLGEVMQVWTNMLMPMAQSGMLAAQNKGVDVSALLDIVGRYGGLQAELQNLVIDMAPNPNVEEKPYSAPQKSEPVPKGQTGGDQGRKTDQITQLMGGKLNSDQSRRAG